MERNTKDSKIYVGGSAYNNGVVFSSENYTAKFAMNNQNNYEITHKKRVQVGGFKKHVMRIPILKGILLLFETPISFLLTGSMIILDIFEYTSKKTESNINSIFLVVAIVIALGILFYITKNVVYKAKLTLEYHGAEHKTIFAYENETELTLDNVRKSPRIARRCGTNVIVFFAFFFIIMSLFVKYGSVRYMVSFVLAYELFDLDNGDSIPVIKLFFKLGQWCQHRIFTREPSDNQIIASIDTLQTLINLETSEKS